VFNRLIAAAGARRQAHAKLLKGKGADVSGAEKSYAAALHASATDIRSLLAAAGHEPTTATMNLVTDTLQTLPGSGPPGRLTEPMKLVGFEALAGLVPKHAPALRGLVARAPATRVASGDEKRDAVARRRDRAATEKALRAARQDARRAESLVAGARTELARAKDARDRLQDQLQFAVKEIDDAVVRVAEGEQRLARAAQERSRLEAKLAELRASWRVAK